MFIPYLSSYEHSGDWKHRPLLIQKVDRKVKGERWCLPAHEKDCFWCSISSTHSKTLLCFLMAKKFDCFSYRYSVNLQCNKINSIKNNGINYWSSYNWPFYLLSFFYFYRLHIYIAYQRAHPYLPSSLSFLPEC